MPPSTLPRFAWPLTIGLATALAAYAVAGIEPALIALVGTIAAALVATAGREAPAPASPDTEREPTIAAVLEAVDSPVLLIAHGRVTQANGAARMLLGTHIVGEDVRVALRHPAAAARLALPDTEADPVELVGLGSLDELWRMHVADAGHGARLVQLIDATGSRAAEQARTDFVANASHELRTPLASILGYAETLADDAGDEPVIRARFLKVMADEARRMQRLVEDLISLSRIEAEKYRRPAAAVDLGALVGEVCAEIRSAGHPRGDALACTVAPGLPPVPGDRPQLSQLLHNLAGNALKYGRAGTPVTLSIADAGRGMLALSVTDEGDGIAPEHIPRLTERFYRVDAGRSRSLGGTGLGLAIVKHIVAHHRGRLDIASRVGVGTTVTVTLPTEPPAIKAGVMKA